MIYSFSVKHTLIIFLILGCSYNSQAQVIGNITNNTTMGYNLVLIPEKEPQKLQGSPYLTKDFIRGKVLIPNKPNFETFLRYNVSAEHFEIKTHPSSSKIYRLPHSSRANYELYPDTYSWKQLETSDNRYSGYFIVIYKGNHYDLLEKKVAKYIKGRRASTSYDRDIPPKVDITNKFFVVASNGEVKEVDFNRRRLKRSFPSDEVNNYLKQHKIKDKESLAEFVKFIDRQ